nr:MAG TPA: hypothetical protein [Herelleviridae sp.]
MTKKEIMKRYLNEKVDFAGFRKEVKNSWLKDRPKSELVYNGLTHKYFYKLSEEAIKLAGYKFPDSDRTYQTVSKVTEELIFENL